MDVDNDEDEDFDMGYEEREQVRTICSINVLLLT